MSNADFDTQQMSPRACHTSVNASKHRRERARTAQPRAIGADQIRRRADLHRG